MDIQEKTYYYFETINEMLGRSNVRDDYYIAKEIINLLEKLDGEHLDADKWPFTEPLVSSFYYLFKKSRFEDAAKLYTLGLSNSFSAIELIEIIKQRALRAETSDNFEVYLFIDNLITFLAKLGHEDVFAGYDEKVARKNETLKHIESSWVNLISGFLSCDDLSKCEMFLMRLMTYCINYFNTVSSSPTQTGTIGMRKWLLKRQLLFLYTAIKVYLIDNVFLFDERDRVYLNRIGTIGLQTYQNYYHVICLSILQIALQMREILLAADKAGVWYKDSVTDYIWKLRNVKKRLSDVGDLFHILFKIRTDLSWIDDIAKDAESELKKGITVTILDQTFTDIKNRIERELSSDKIEKRAGRIKGSLKRKNGIIWKVIRERINEKRLQLLAVSLDNKYSSESMFFFNEDTVKLEYDSMENQFVSPSTELHILKKYGSTASVFERNKRFHANFGGGFFLYHRGIGLAIDPGPDFLNNLARYTDFDLFDIHSIVCTHTHLDHIGDVVRVMNGIREYQQHVGNKQIRLLLVDEDDNIMFPRKIRESFCINVLDKPGTFKYPEHAESYFLPDNQYRDNGIEIIPLPVKHKIYRDARLLEGTSKREKTRIKRKVLKEYRKIGRALDKDGWRTWSHGLLLKLYENSVPICSILFSGDAEYEEGLFDSIYPDLTVLNVSSVRFKDVFATPLSGPLSVDSKRKKKNHLGYSGTCYLTLTNFHNCSKINILDEFFEAQSELDARPFITSAISSDIAIRKRVTKPVLVGETGTRIKIGNSNLKVFCSTTCGDDRGFVPISADILQCRSSRFTRTERIAMACSQCARKKKEMDFFFYT